MSLGNAGNTLDGQLQNVVSQNEEGEGEGEEEDDMINWLKYSRRGESEGDLAQHDSSHQTSLARPSLLFPPYLGWQGERYWSDQIKSPCQYDKVIK